jgi:hypothetical protein
MESPLVYPGAYRAVEDTPTSKLTKPWSYPAADGSTVPGPLMMDRKRRPLHRSDGWPNRRHHDRRGPRAADLGIAAFDAFAGERSE